MLDLGLSNINWIAVIAAAVVNMVVGFVWYSKVLFASRWMKLTGKTDMQGQGASMGYALMSVGSLVSAFVLAWLVGVSGAVSLLDGAVVGLLAAVGLVATSHAANYIFEGRSMDLYLINVGYFVVAYVLMGALIAAL